MPAFNVADYQSFVRSFMINSIKTAIPELDISDNSAFDDLFIKPMLEVIPPLLNTINSLEFTMNLDNAQFMTEEELDDIGKGNYLLERNGGEKATTTLTLSFLNVNTSVNLTVPVGSIFATQEGLRFQTTQMYEFTPTELLAGYNPSKTTYDVQIQVTAIETGVAYNVSENQINTAITNISNSLASVSNKSAVTSGIDKETNVDYAARIKNYYVSRYLGTKPGYDQFIRENFPEVEDIYIAGFGDDEMQRDLMTVIKDLVPETMHMGGKVDIYIKGSTYSNNTTSLTLNSLTLKLTQKYSDIIILSVVLENLTDPLKVPEFTIADDGSDNAIVTIVNNTEQSFDPLIVSQMKVSYSYDPGAVATSETFSVGLSQIALNNPFKAVSSIYETSNQTNNYTDASYYEIIRTQLDGTLIPDELDPYYGSSKEYASIKMINLDTVLNGTNLTIEYTTNQTVADMTTKFDIEGNRIITTDIMFKETQPVYINIGFSIKLKTGFTLDDVKISAINNILIDYFNTLGLGSTVEESDIVGALYRDAGIFEYLEYVLLPLESFYVPDDLADPIIAQSDGPFITTTNLQYPALNKTSITEIT
jgi:hypothetical protein